MEKFIAWFLTWAAISLVSLNLYYDGAIEKWIKDHWENKNHSQQLVSDTPNSKKQNLDLIQPTPSSQLQQSRSGMTWGVLKHPAIAPEFVNVDCAGLPGERTASGHNCDPYKGDTQCTKKLPLLCVHEMGRPFPDDILERQEYHGWFGGDVDTSIIVQGTDLTSRESADKICAAKLGVGWRMAEFHDGRGWGFWAEGKVRNDTRFWVAINDQPANCWDGRVIVPEPHENTGPRKGRPDFIPEELYSPRLER